MLLIPESRINYLPFNKVIFIVDAFLNTQYSNLFLQ